MYGPVIYSWYAYVYVVQIWKNRHASSVPEEQVRVQPARSATNATGAVPSAKTTEALDLGASQSTASEIEINLSVSFVC